MIREPPWLTLLLLRRERVAQTARHWRLPEMDREGQFIDRDRANAQISHKPTRIIDLHELQINVRYPRSEEHTSELTSLMRISYAVFCLTKTIHEHYN